MPLVTRNTGAGNIYVDATQPTDATLGTIWVNTSTSPPTIEVADGSTYVPVVDGSTQLTIFGNTFTLEQAIAGV
jgi:hypothetical protein